MIMDEMNDRQRLKILIADDAEFNRALFGMMLGNEYDILEAADGREAIKILENYGIDIALVLLDVVMPGTDGFGVLEAMRENGWIESIPVIMISSEDSSEIVQRAYDMGATDFISRSVKTAVIKKRVQNTIRLFARQKLMLRLMEEENRRLEDKNYRLTRIDGLTGCLTLDGFREKAVEIIHENPEKQYSLCYSDIKNFKFINEVFGYEAGNELLKTWSSLTKAAIDDDEVLGRISADRFALLAKTGGSYGIRPELKKVLCSVSRFFKDINKSYTVEICTGVYIIKPHDLDKISVDQMLDLARIAQRTVKGKIGGGRAIFDEEQWERQWRNMAITNHLDEAIAGGEVSVWLQPQYNYVTGKIIGAEALCRWTHSELGWLSPGEFIPLLEKTGQILKLDYYVWDQACRLMKKWQENGRGIPISISVNISRADLRDEDLSAKLMELVKKYSLNPEMLRLEITESSYMEEPEKLIDTVAQLQKMGFVVEMDDFGSGYSSLNMLKEVPVDVLKIDFKFLHGKGIGARSGIIISSVLKMAHQLGMPVICEGVETKEQAEFMKNLDCTMMQGFYFAKPMPVREFEEKLENSSFAGLTQIKGRTYLRELNELMDTDSSSSYIFNNCIGAAGLLEYRNGRIEAILVNDSFYNEFGFEREQHIYSVNLLDFVYKDDRESTIKAMEEAVDNGGSEIEFRFGVGNKWVFAKNRRISVDDNGNVIFALLGVISEKYEHRHM